MSNMDSRSSLTQLVNVQRMSSSERAGDRLRSRRVSMGALEVAKDLEKTWKRLRRQALRAADTAPGGWHTHHASHKYGQLASHLIDFLQPAVNVKKNQPPESLEEAISTLNALHEELKARATLVEEAHGALQALQQLLQSPHSTVRSRALSQIVRSPSVLRPDARAASGAGHELANAFTMTVHTVYASLLSMIEG